MFRKLTLYLLATVVVVYCTGLLYHVQEAKDLGIHCLFSEPASDARARPARPRISWVDIDVEVVGPSPSRGDRLVRVAGEDTPTFLHFKRLVNDISQQQRPEVVTAPAVLPGDAVAPVDQRFELLGLLDRDPATGTVQLGGKTWVRVDFLPATGPKAGQLASAWLRLKPLPNRFVVLSAAWFLVEMIVFAIGAVIFLKRPRDRSAGLFVALCATSIIAFMGAFHWSDLVGTRLLVYPFAICALLLPPLTLHFYLLFPRPSFVLRRWPGPMLAGIYTVPLVWMVLMLAVLIAASRAYAQGAAAAEVVLWLDRLRTLVYGYLAVAVVFFAVGQGLLIHAFIHSRTLTQRKQAREVLVAVTLAGLLLVYLLYTGLTDRAQFAFGSKTRIALYLVSVLFTLAYAVIMTRYKLLQLGELVNRGVFYVGVSLAATAIFCLLVGVGTALLGKYAFRLENAVAVGVTAMLVVVVLGWARQRFQRALDHRFARERYQLDVAMQRLGEAVDALVSPAQVAQAWLQAACDAVGAQGGLVYLRSDRRKPFVLAARAHWPGAAEWIEPRTALAAQLLEQGVVSSRVSRGMPTAGQLELREMDARISFGIEVDGQLLGIGLLGPKRGGTYSADDRNFLAALARTTALALRGAEAQRTIETLKEKLQAQVSKIAEQQQRIHYLQTELLGTRQNQQPSPASTVVRRAASSDRAVETAIRGSSRAVRQMLDQAVKIAGSRAAVLIRGESGTGKELLARTIHDNSPRASRAFVAVHCAALSPSLQESELFGHVKGAFTGADRPRVGRFEKANGGTLFLDEVGDISFETQTKLLRVIQEQAFERVGATETIHVDVRIIAATHRDLEAMIREGRFREDLYYRLNVVSLVCPPLRDRRDDIFELALYFLRREAQQNGKPIVRIADEAIEILRAYDWPGNVRELENAIQRAVILAEGDTIQPADLPPEIAAGRRRWVPSSARHGQPLSVSRAAVAVPTRGASPPQAPRPDAPIDDKLASIERQHLLDALAQAGGNKSQAARLLGIPRSTLFSKLRRLGIE